jgi:hypothetical protein
MATTTKKKPAAKKTTTTKKAATTKKTTTAKKATATKKTTTAKPAAKKATATKKTTATKTTAKKVVASAPKVGGEISVNGNKIIQTVQKEFSKKFEYLTLCFIVDEDRGKSVNVRGINTTRRISEARKKVSTKEISIHGRTKVQNIEDYFWKELGIACQIGICGYNGHAHYFPIGSWFNEDSLTQANEWAKGAGCKKVGATEIKQICSGTIF